MDGITVVVILAAIAGGTIGASLVLLRENRALRRELHEQLRTGGSGPVATTTAAPDVAPPRTAPLPVVAPDTIAAEVDVDLDPVVHLPPPRIEIDLRDPVAPLPPAGTPDDLVLRHAGDVALVLGPGFRVLHQSASTTRTLGYRNRSLEGRPFTDLLHTDDAGRFEAVAVEVVQRGTPATLTIRVAHADGGWRDVDAAVSTDPDLEQAASVVVTMRDITAQLAMQERLAHQALHDELTGLPNRALFRDRVAQAVARPRGNSAPALVVVDIGAHAVNDVAGRRCGDRLLQDAARRLQAFIRPGDTVARIAGDDFGILVDEVPAGGIGAVADRAMEALRAPFAILGREVYAEPTAGIAVSSPTITGADDLLRNADLALHLAKARGRGGYVSYDPEAHGAVVDQAELRAELRRGIERGEFVVVYQPIVELHTRRMVGMEALVRWRHPIRGEISPATFIPLAESSGLIVPLGRWILQTAFDTAAGLSSSAPHPIVMTVNVSMRQLQDPALVADVREALDISGADPSGIVLEITESEVMAEAEATLERLDELKALGLQLALDDFGTGYSSLSHLQRLPVDILKIDASFVDALHGDSETERHSLAGMIVDMGRRLGLQVLAEGVERREQASTLLDLGCPWVQGWHFARTLDVPAVCDLLAAGARFDSVAITAGDFPPIIGAGGEVDLRGT